MNGPVKTIRFLLQAVCLFLMAAGLAGVLLASFFVSAMVIVWFQEGALQSTDQKMLGQGAKWLLASGAVVTFAWWLRRRIVANKDDDTFRLVASKTGRPENLAQGVFEILFFVCVVIGLWAVTPASAIMKLPLVAAWFALAYLGMHGRIALHELGHLLAGWLLGMELRKVQIGIGPLLWSGSFSNGLFWEWRLWARGGFVVATHRSTKGYRARQFLVIAAGPLMDLVLLWSSYQLIARAFGGLAAAFSQGAFGFTVWILFWSTVLSAIEGLVPYRLWMGHHKVWTDGYWLVRLLTGSSGHVAELAQNSDWLGLLDLLQSDGTRSAAFSDAIGRELLASSAAFHEQRTLLSSRLLRKPSFTFGPPA
jgi:Peptidase family M50